MNDGTMREAFEAAIAEGHQVEWFTFEIAWQAAYRAGQQSQGRRDAYNKGYAAGMERAAGICDQNSEQWDTPANGTAAYAAGRCADAIRAEIKGDRNA
ncbi:hypothetical protein NDR89_23345 [Cupriavidus gilardii]|uniref:ANR family transcriptional regulator n=1 Tax=Cupriavidus gilardii TaxID=82541 RepID=A0ABY4VXN4_9BURK|nr:hypothetical protein [Cupriavidus gilardii]USE79530.1 hypothetical protein NDR89_23345 [Cupriavidus gilardii]